MFHLTSEQKNLYFFVLSLICLFTYASTLHKLNIFRFSTGPIIGILFLVYFIEQKFPQDKNSNKQLNLELNKYVSWKLYDKSNSEEDGDQLRTVVGICLMFTALTLIGLYSSII